MSRVKYVLKPSDYPGNPDEATKTALANFFQHLFPNGEQGEPHAGYAMLGQTPRVAMGIIDLADVIIYDTILAERRDLREIAVQTLNLHFKCDFSFQAHLPIAVAHGISLEQQAAIPYWQVTSLFDEEQKLMIEFTQACIQGPVAEELFAKFAGLYGEKAAIEFTIGIAWWVFWAIILNATAPEFSSARSQPLPKDMAAESGAAA